MQYFDHCLKVDTKVCLGRICQAKAGRGKGKYFMICGIVNDCYVLLTDGSSRKITKPKLKKIKHIRCLPYVEIEIAAIISKGKLPSDAEIKKVLCRVMAVEKSKEK